MYSATVSSTLETCPNRIMAACESYKSVCSITHVLLTAIASSTQAAVSTTKTSLAKPGHSSVLVMVCKERRSPPPICSLKPAVPPARTPMREEAEPSTGAALGAGVSSVETSVIPNPKRSSSGLSMLKTETMTSNVVGSR